MMKQNIYKTFSVLLFFVMLLFSPFSVFGGTEMPPFSLKSIPEGKAVDSKQFENKAILIAFFATWCPPCRAEAPDLVKVQNEFSEKGFTVIGMSMDIGKTAEVEKFMDEFSVNYPILMADRNVIQQYGGVYTIPTSFLVDKKGNVVKMYQGAVSHRTLVKDISSVL